MTAVATLSIPCLEDKVTETSTLFRNKLPGISPLLKSKDNLIETKCNILANISSTLKDDIEKKRQERKAQKLADATKILATKAKRSHPTTWPGAKSCSATNVAHQPDYCEYRPQRRSQAFFDQEPSDGRPCECSIPHLRLRPNQWKSTPAEETEWDYSLPNGGPAEREVKVKFADDPVTEVRVFERWYQDEYELSDRYWAKGPVRMTEDWSSRSDDDLEILCLEAADAAKQLVLEDSDVLDHGEKNFGSDDIDFAIDEDEDRSREEATDGGPLVRMV